MDKAVADNDRVGRTMTSDSTTAVRFNDFWGRWTKTGVHGNSAKASAEKGKQILELIMQHAKLPVVGQRVGHDRRAGITWPAGRSRPDLAHFGATGRSACPASPKGARGRSPRPSGSCSSRRPAGRDNRRRR